jgi:hypothetical protein
MIDSTVETLQPQYCQYILDNHNPSNRKRSHTVTKKYARDMKAGAWELTGEPIIFDENGDLLTGQHRLAACVEAEVPFTTAVQRGVASRSRIAIDSGKPQSIADWLGYKGKSNTRTLGAAATLLFNYHDSCFTGDGSRGTSRSAADSVVDEMLEQAASWADGQDRSVGRGMLAFLKYCGDHVNPARTEKFINGLSTGEGLAASDPAYLLRARLVTKGGKRVTQRVRIALCLKALNFALTDTKVAQLKFGKVESIPVVKGYLPRCR